MSISSKSFLVYLLISRIFSGNLEMKNNRYSITGMLFVIIAVSNKYSKIDMHGNLSGAEKEGEVISGLEDVHIN